MPILYVLIVLVVIGVLLGVLNKNILFPLDPKIMMIINVVVVLGTIIWLLQAFGLLSGSIGSVHTGEAPHR